MRLPLFKTNGQTDSRIEPNPRSKDHRNATIVTDPEITGTGMQNIASIGTIFQVTSDDEI